MAAEQQQYTSLPPASQLPTQDRLRGAPPRWHEDAVQVAHAFVDAFNAALEDPSAFSGLFLEGEGWWRDILAFTNDYRTIRSPNILQAARARLASVQAQQARLRHTPAPSIVRPFEELEYSFLELHFDFTTATGPAFGLARLIPGPEPAGPWKIFTLFTLLEGVHGHPERIDGRRAHGKHNSSMPWHVEREEGIQFKDRQPDVVIIGAGHNGLQLAARLQAVGLDPLVIDRENRIGDNWRLRYESLSLHDPVYANHFSFMPFPASWPVFTPAGKLGNWMESYVDALDLNVWCETRCLPDETDFDAAASTWRVTVVRNGIKVALRPKHVVLATGLCGGFPRLPAPFPGQASYEAAGGRLVHSSGHGSSKAWKGKKALVVGACTSAHDISLDLLNHGCEVTMLQRSATFIMTVRNGMEVYHSPLFSPTSPPTEVADRKLESIPKHVLFLHHKSLTATVQAKDADLLGRLERAGFLLTKGPDGTGWQRLALEKAGGYYFDTGASEKVADGSIKLKRGQIHSFESKVVRFEDATEEQFDTVIFATGYSGFEDTLRSTLGEKYVAQMRPVFGLDEEGETCAVARESGIPSMYWMVGHLALARLLSKIIATQILAEQLGRFGPRYTLEVQRQQSYTVA